MGASGREPTPSVWPVTVQRNRSQPFQEFVRCLRPLCRERLGGLLKYYDREAG